MVIFTLLALVSALSLDYLAWRKGEKSYVFQAFKKGKRPFFPKGRLNQIAFKNLSDYGLSSDSIDQYTDKKGASHLLVDLTLKKYKKLESTLKKEFLKVKASVLKKEEQKTDKKNYYLWEVKRKKKEKLIILFSCLKEKVKKEKKPYPEEKKKVAIIIDDMGYSLRAVKEACSIKKPLTIAVLPFSPLARETAQIAHQNGLEVILHLPLEPINNQKEYNGTEGMINSNMSKEEVIKAVNRCLDQVPYIVGVNNHMGSKITASEIFMRIILERLRERNLFFVDSRTTAESVAYDIAQLLSIPSTYRNVFLDTDNNEKSIKKRMLELFELAQKKGQALGICHPTTTTFKVLKENIHLIDKFKLVPVFASQIVHLNEDIE